MANSPYKTPRELINNNKKEGLSTGGMSNYVEGEEDVPSTTSPKKLNQQFYVLLRE
jgi:hypothetical protein